MQGMEVRPRRAREAFWRWEQAWARRTRDMMGEAGEVDGFCGGWFGWVGGEVSTW